MQETEETWVRPLGREDPLEEKMTTHSSILAWRIPMNRGAWWATVHRVTKSPRRLAQTGTPSLLVALGLLVAVASLVAEHRV